MARKGKFSYSATADSARIAEYLTKIAEGLVTGSISLAADTRVINLEPADHVKVEIEAEGSADKGRGRIVMEISWKAVTEAPAGKLEISTQPIVEEGPHAPEAPTGHTVDE